MYGYNPLAIEQLHQARITRLRQDATAARAARIGRRRGGTGTRVTPPTEDRAQSTM